MNWRWHLYPLLKPRGASRPMFNPKERHQCGDCGVREGEMHALGCTVEHCGWCHGQRISCDCEGTDVPRLPFILYPQLCGRCGEPFPKVFWVSDAAWKAVVGPNRTGLVLCKSCYSWIKRLLRVRVR
jgi:hypothetical protein